MWPSVMNQYSVQNKMLGIAIKYIFHSYGIDIRIPVMGRLDIEISEDYDIAFENMYALSDLGRLFDYNNFSLFGFKTYDLGNTVEEIKTSFEKLPKAVHKISGVKTKQWLEEEPDITFCYLLYHPCYKRFSEWSKMNSIDNVFTKLYQLVNDRLEVIHNQSFGIQKDTCEAGAVFPIYYHEDCDYIFDSDETMFHMDSIFAAFVLQCLIVVAEKRGFNG
jgi:hypothetical protein